MPRFLLTVFLATAASFTGLVLFMKYTEPSGTRNLIIFFFLFWVFLTFLISIPTYAINYKFAARLSNLKNVYRNSLRFSAFLAFALVGIACLKVLNSLNPLNAFLEILLLTSLYKLLVKP